MDMCDDDHPNIVFDARECPACALRSEMQEEVDDLGKSIDRLIEEKDDLDSQLYDAKEELKQYADLKDKLDKMVKERI